MAITYRKISSSTLGAGQTTINLSSIPQTYTDLVVRGFLRSTAATRFQQLQVTFNNNTGGNYSNSGVQLSESGGSTSYTTFNQTGQSSLGAMRMNGATSSNDTFTDVEIYIPNYTSTSRRAVGFFSSAENDNGLYVYWTWGGNTYKVTGSALTSIQITQPTDAFVAGSTIYLYGILKA